MKASGRFFSEGCPGKAEAFTYMAGAGASPGLVQAVCKLLRAGACKKLHCKADFFRYNKVKITPGGRGRRGSVPAG